MSKKLNKEEMRLKLIAIFKESGSFFQMKEIETEGRNKGISQKDVKEIMSSLTSEEIIKTSCIGNTNFYWLESLQIKLDEKRDKLKELKEKYKQVKELRDNLKEKAKMVESKEEESDKIKRQNLQDEVKNLKTKEKELRDKISALKNSLNSEDGKAIEEKIQPLCDAANRWTDNIFMAMEWSVKKFNLENSKPLYKECKIPEDLDYLNT